MAFSLLLAGAASAQEQPGEQVSRIDRLTVTEWVKSSPQNEFRARVLVPIVGRGAELIPNARVILLGRNGTRYEGMSDEKGEVVIPDVKPGVYAMSARGRGVYATYAMHVLDAENGSSDLYPDSVDISCASLTYNTFTSTVMPLLANEYDREVLTIEDAKLDELVGHVRGNEQYQVVRSRDNGGVIGFVYEAAANGENAEDDDIDDRLDPAELTNIFLFRGDIQVGRDITDARGRFEVPNLETGVYSLIAVGPDGIGAVGFELLDEADFADSANLRSSDGYRFAQLPVANGNAQFAFQILPQTPEEIQYQQEPTPGEEPLILPEPPIIDGFPIEGFPIEGIPIEGMPLASPTPTGGVVGGLGGPSGAVGGIGPGAALLPATIAAIIIAADGDGGGTTLVAQPSPPIVLQ